MRHLSRRAPYILAALALAAGTFVADSGQSSAATTYNVTTGAYNGTRSAASTVVGEWTCSGLTTNRLAAIMLSIPVWEIAGGSSSTSSSPMTLSRWDGWSSSKNRPLYSHTEYPSYKRAHWNPGVGLWQLDTWAATLHLNHGQRANARTGGLEVARYLRDGYCSGTSTLKSRLNGNWFGCRTDKCYNTYLSMYNSSNDSLRVNKTSGSQYDGGVTNRSCRWGSGSSWTCYYYNTNAYEGYMDVTDPNGDGARTPLAAPFLSFTTSNIKRAAWLRGSTGYDKEIVKAARTTENARYSSVYSSTNGWYDWTSLQVWKCTSSCWWSTWGP
ncbi:MAG: hypothetical protein QNJ12_18180 [Ilumatobacter sp.]|uniref:hypothetical protein n=1 Tax=Ilumatobacter sp. TaxID=1967498 RepID=UPI002629F88B|nr:hypothetical protein [Ilumatobacter sp.]MDJ0770727.1 hypothetical protein [Ilumatobacter sp.]